jgi:small conductance mechanosensitive channel
MSADPEKLWAQFGPVAIELALDLASALLVIIIGWLVASWAHRAVRRGLSRFADLDRTLIGVVAGVARYFVLITVLIMVLGRFGVQTASILAALGTIGLAVGLALQGTLTNIASGVMLLVLRPFRAGDYVNANGHEGTVEEVGLFTTQMTTYDGLYQTVPNSDIWDGRVVNYSRNLTRRHDIVVGISYRDDRDRAEQALLELLRGDPRVLQGEQAPSEPQVLVRELADSAVTLGLRFWTSADDYWPANFELRKGAKQALDAAAITIPYPQHDIHLYDTRTSA